MAKFSVRNLSLKKIDNEFTFVDRSDATIVNVNIHRYDRSIPTESTTRVCPGIEYSLKVGGEQVKINGKVLTFKPMNGQRIINGINFLATIYHDGVPVDQGMVKIYGDVPMILGQCPDCPCFSGRCVNGKCVPEMKCMGQCSGRCDGVCSGTGVCVGDKGTYSCVMGTNTVYPIVLIFVVIILIAVFIFFQNGRS